MKKNPREVNIRSNDVKQQGQLVLFKNLESFEYDRYAYKED